MPCLFFLGQHPCSSHSRLWQILGFRLCHLGLLYRFPAVPVRKNPNIISFHCIVVHEQDTDSIDILLFLCWRPWSLRSGSCDRTGGAAIRGVCMACLTGGLPGLVCVSSNRSGGLALLSSASSSSSVPSSASSSCSWLCVIPVIIREGPFLHTEGSVQVVFYVCWHNLTLC